MASDAEHDDHSRSPSADESGSDDGVNGGDDHDMDGKNGHPDGAGKKKTNSKDPSRPRRKKARRACYACQRAHLTCGDERPCQRCVKRGLQDSCQDGVRKKAKYLHDAPPEALMPGGANYYNANNMRRPQQDQTTSTYPLNVTATAYNAQQPNVTYAGFSPNQPLPMNDNLVSPAFNTAQSPLGSQVQANATMPTAPMDNLAATLPPQTASEDSGTLTTGFDSNLFDPGDLSQYDFDPTSFNFGNHYGALEFGMLGHLGSRAAGTTPPGEVGNPMSAVTAFATPNTLSTSNFAESPVDGNQALMFSQDGLTDWRGLAQNQSNVRGLNVRASRSRDGQNGPYDADNPKAFSVGINSGGASPTATRSPQQQVKQTYRDGAPRTRYGASPGGRAPGGEQGKDQQALQSQNLFNVANTRALYPKRKRGEPSAIYTNVTQPYSYITGFHSLIQLLEKQFPPAKVLRIAKALSSIRPSFMACTRTLNRDDLIFMEKCFQRTLWEYEDFINACGTPTVVCRRTGEIAAAGKEFSILTKWRRDILLGREANLNVNTGSSSVNGPGASGTSSARGGATTPRIPASMIDHSRPHPVSLAELLDEDSVVAFYEDFARLAFGDSKGVVNARYKLLKYRTKDEETRLASERENRALLKRKRGSNAAAAAAPNNNNNNSSSSNSSSSKPGGENIAGEAGIEDLGEHGKVECSCCWTVKRDIFDLPMMIVMNMESVLLAYLPALERGCKVAKLLHGWIASSEA